MICKRKVYVMLYYDFISYGDWIFIIKVFKNGLKFIDIYNY